MTAGERQPETARKTWDSPAVVRLGPVTKVTQKDVGANDGFFLNPDDPSPIPIGSI